MRATTNTAIITAAATQDSHPDRRALLSQIVALYFWALPVSTVAVAGHYVPWIDYRLAGSTIVEAIHGNIDLVSEPAFAYALAGILGCFAAGLGIAFFLLHVAPVWFALWRATRLVSAAQGRDRKRAETRRSFAAEFEGLSQKLEGNWDGRSKTRLMAARCS